MRFTTILFLLCSFAMSAQDYQELSTLDISKIESKRFAVDRYKAGSEDFNGNNYDWLYAECYWKVDPFERFIEARVVHTLEMLENSDTLSFDFTDVLSVNQVLVNGLPANFFFNDPYTLSIVRSNMAGLVEVEIKYQGNPIVPGVFSFVQSFHGLEPLIYTLSQPYGAKDWWPCKQTLTDKADSVFIEITVPLGDKAGSNGKLLYTENRTDTTIAFGWKHRYPIPAYLISMAVTNYAEFEQLVEFDGDTIQILNYVYPELLQQESLRAEDIPPMMVLFSELFGIYPYADEKYGHAQSAIPGGMEHTTMSTMSGLSYNLSAHELAHQWFGDKVTCGSWEDIWLNEGFATFLTAVALQHLREPEVYESWKSSTLANITSQPGGSVFVDDTLNVSRVFDGRLSYNKGAYLLMMLRWLMGEEPFYQACRNYLNDPDIAFSYAKTPQFKSHLEAVYGESLDGFFDDWFYGQGYPEYTLNWTPNDEGAVVRIFQTQSHPSVEFFEIPLPVRVTTDVGEFDRRLDLRFSGEEFLLEVPGTVQSVALNPDLEILATSRVIFDPDGRSDINEIRIFPNPAIDQLKFSVLNPAFNADELEVLDVQGKQLIHRKIFGGLSGGYLLDVSGLSAGTYVLKLSKGSSSKSARFVVGSKP